MKRLIYLIALVAFTANAENKVYDGPGPKDYKLLEATNLKPTPISKYSEYPEHSGKSPKAFDKFRIPSDTFLVSDVGTDNDIYKTRDDNKEYELNFHFTLNRYVGDIATLKANNLISENFKLIIPAFDVDPYSKQEDCDGDGILDNLRPEVDEVYLNGELIGTLSGNNETWNVDNNTFTIPIEKLNLPTQYKDVSSNNVSIKIDVANKDVVLSSGAIGCKAWATEIDYVAIDYELVEPVVMFAGLSGSDQAFLNSGYTDKLSNRGIINAVYGHSFSGGGKCVSNEPVSFKAHSEEYKQKLIELAEIYKVNRFNLITHSKSGVDVRHLIKDLNENPVLVETSILDDSIVKNPLIINSVVTNGSPHLGSVAASALRYGQLIDGGIIAEIQPDYCDIDVEIATRFTEHNEIPEEVIFLAIGADADVDDDSIISSEENEDNQIPFVSKAQEIYDLIKDYKMYERSGYKSEYLCITPDVDCVEIELPAYTGIPTISPRYNDTSVSEYSALPRDADYTMESDGNHATILFGEETPGVHTGMQDIVIEQGVNGVLKWRNKK